LVLGVLKTQASMHEIANLEEVLDTSDLPKHIAFRSDKGYQSAKNVALLTKRKLKNYFLKKAKKGKPLKESEKRFNKLVGKTRFKLGAAVYTGIKKYVYKIYWKLFATIYIEVLR
jgi:IS5 family transposase